MPPGGAPRLDAAISKQVSALHVETYGTPVTDVTTCVHDHLAVERERDAQSVVERASLCGPGTAHGLAEGSVASCDMDPA
jgi:hypothetical protein